jgi:6-pyruvoyl-tetrahydropterin synthase related domain
VSRIWGSTLAVTVRGRPLKPHLPALLLFVGLTLFMLSPVLGDPTHRSFGIYSNEKGFIWQLVQYRELGVLPYSGAETPSAGYPFGSSIEPPFGLHQIVLMYAAYALSFPLGIYGAYNALVFLGFFLSASAMYALCWHLTRNRLAAAFAGLVYGFNPWMVDMMRQGHLPYLQVWFLPLLVLAAIMFHRRPNLRHAAVIALVAGTMAYVDAYLAMFGLTVLGVFLLHQLVAARATSEERRRRLVGLGAIVGVVAALVAPALLVVFTSSAAGGQLARGKESFEQFQALYSARPRDYLMASPDNWFVSDTYAEMRRNELFIRANHAVGFVPLVLAVLGVAVAFRRRRRRPEVAFLVAIGAVGFLLTMPSHVGVFGVSIPLATPIAYEVTSYFRDFSRAFFLVALAVAALAALGLAWWRPTLSARRRIILVGAASILSAVWLNSGVPSPAYNYSSDAPAVYRALAGLPQERVVVEYPLWPVGGAGAGEYQQWYLVHRHPLVNAWWEGTAGDDLRQFLTNPEGPQVAATLRTLGVGYVLVHGSQVTRFFESQNLLSPFPVGASPPPLGEGYRLVAERGQARIYRVVASPAKAVTTIRPAPELRQVGRKPWWLLVGARTSLHVWNFGACQRAVVALRVRSLDSGLRVRVLDRSRAVLAEKTLPPEAVRTLNFEVQLRQDADVTVQAELLDPPGTRGVLPGAIPFGGVASGEKAFGGLVMQQPVTRAAGCNLPAPLLSPADLVALA